MGLDTINIDDELLICIVSSRQKVFGCSVQTSSDSSPAIETAMRSFPEVSGDLIFVDQSADPSFENSVRSMYRVEGEQ